MILNTSFLEYALVLLRINQYTQFEVPSFTSSKEIIGAKVRDSDHAPFRGGLSS